MVMMGTTSPALIDLIQEAAHPLTGSAADFDPLMALIGDARFVLLGEASHGTHEFYRARAEITRRLIREKGFTAVAVEAPPGDPQDREILSATDKLMIMRFVDPDANRRYGTFVYVRCGA